MSYIGDFALESTFDTKFTTVTTTGAPTTLAGTPVVSAYVGNSTTQLTAGITLTVDFDGVTGLHNVRVVATAANGYATASNYQLVITTGTVGGTSVVGYVVAEFSIEARAFLRPTTAGRTLDVSAGGEAGIDWANIGGPTTAQNLSATNIDVDQVVASVSGAVGSVAAGGITAASIATDAIDADAIAAGAIDAAAIADGAIDALTFAAGAINAAAIADGAIDALTFAAGAIDAAAIAANAIGASELAADAVTEIQAGLATSAALATVQADTDDIQTRLPAALVGGRMDSSVGAMSANVLTASALATDAATEIRSLASGTSDSGTTTTMVDAARTEADADYWKGQIILFTSGTLLGQARLITAFDPATDTITFSPATTVAAGTHTYEILPDGRADIGLWLGVAPSVLISGRVDANTQAMGTDVIGAAQIATDAIGSAELAASAVTEIQSGLATSAAIAAIQADTDDIQTRLPAALVGGRIDSSVGAMAADVVTATAIATDAIGSAELAASAVTEIQSGLATAAALATVQADTDDIQTRLPAALVAGRIDSSVGAMAAGVVTAAAVATGAVDADALATDAAEEIADAILGRNLAGGSNGGRDIRSALRVLRNRRAIVAGTLTVRQEDDTTVAWTAAVTTAAGNPITDVDPA